MSKKKDQNDYNQYNFFKLQKKKNQKQKEKGNQAYVRKIVFKKTLLLQWTWQLAIRFV
jgi:hypothetical protein